MDSMKNRDIAQNVSDSQKIENKNIDLVMESTMKKLGLTGTVEENDIEAYYFYGPWRECWSPCSPCPQYTLRDPCGAYSGCHVPPCGADKRYSMMKSDIHPVDTIPYKKDHSPEKITRKLRSQKLAMHKRMKENMREAVKRQESQTSTANSGSQYGQTDAFDTLNASTATDNPSQHSSNVQTENLEAEGSKTQAFGACQCPRRFVASTTRNVLPYCPCVKGIQASTPTADKYTCTCCLSQARRAQHTARPCDCRNKRDSIDDARYAQEMRRTYCRPRVICEQFENHDPYKILDDSYLNIRSCTSNAGREARDITCKIAGKLKEAFGLAPCNLVCLTHFTNKVLTSRSDQSLYTESEVSQQGDYDISEENSYDRYTRKIFPDI